MRMDWRLVGFVVAALVVAVASVVLIVRWRRRHRMATPVEMYCGLMEDAKGRIALIGRITNGSLLHGAENFDYECVSLHLRKVLEAIAFGSLCANQVEYAKVHANFDKHWRAKDLLRALEKINPNFYPAPLRFVPTNTPGHKLVEPVPAGYLTQQEFADLYDTCNKVLHLWNPFSPDARHINFGRTVAEWISRIQQLLDLHMMQLAGTEDIWMIQMVHPEDGKVHAFPASPR
jgi:hypothetical protein